MWCQARMRELWAIPLCFGASLGQRGRIFGRSQRKKEIKKNANKPATLALSDRGAMPSRVMGVMLVAGVLRGSKRQLEAVAAKVQGCQSRPRQSPGMNETQQA